MNHILVLDEYKKNCVDGRVISEYTVNPAPDEGFIEYLKSCGPVIQKTAGNLSFFKIEWDPKITVKGIAGDEFIYVSYVCDEKEAFLYVTDLFKGYEEKVL